MAVSTSKRLLLKHLAQLGLAYAALPSFSTQAVAQALSKGNKKQFRYATIPGSGQRIHPIGMGTWITFNVGNDLGLRQQRVQVLKTFFELGGEMVDSSPMYGSAEQVVGHALNKLNNAEKIFATTKTWTSSASEGKQQFIDSQQLWQRDKFALLQIHNLVAWRDHLPMLRELKQQGLIKYLGVTTSHGRRHSELERIIKSEPLDFVQLTYNIDDREAERRLLPLAQDKDIAIIANRPLQGGRLMDRFERQPLPKWAAELGCDNWAQFFLRFIISHPAITCAIPATSKVEHMRENMNAANTQPFPSAKQRQQMIRYMESL